MIFVFSYILSVVCLRKQGSSPKPQSHRQGCMWGSCSHQRSVFAKRWRLATAQLWPATNKVKWFFASVSTKASVNSSVWKVFKTHSNYVVLGINSVWKHSKEPVGYFNSLISAPFSWLWKPAAELPLWACLEWRGFGPSQSEVQALCPWTWTLLPSPPGCGQTWGRTSW